MANINNIYLQHNSSGDGGMPCIDIKHNNQEIPEREINPCGNGSNESKVQKKFNETITTNSSTETMEETKAIDTDGCNYKQDEVVLSVSSPNYTQHKKSFIKEKRSKEILEKKKRDLEKMMFILQQQINKLEELGDLEELGEEEKKLLGIHENKLSKQEEEKLIKDLEKFNFKLFNKKGEIIIFHNSNSSKKLSLIYECSEVEKFIKPFISIQNALGSDSQLDTSQFLANGNVGITYKGQRITLCRRDFLKIWHAIEKVEEFPFSVEIRNEKFKIGYLESSEFYIGKIGGKKLRVDKKQLIEFWLFDNCKEIKSDMFIDTKKETTPIDSNQDYIRCIVRNKELTEKYSDYQVAYGKILFEGVLEGSKSLSESRWGFDKLIAHAIKKRKQAADLKEDDGYGKENAEDYGVYRRREMRSMTREMYEPLARRLQGKIYNICKQHVDNIANKKQNDVIYESSSLRITLNIDDVSLDEKLKCETLLKINEFSQTLTSFEVLTEDSYLIVNEEEHLLLPYYGLHQVNHTKWRDCYRLMDEVRKYFDEAMNINMPLEDSKQELICKLGKVYWMICQIKPWERGDPSIAEIMIRAIYHHKTGEHLPPWNNELIPWVETVVEFDISEFGKKFHKLFDWEYFGE